MKIKVSELTGTALDLAVAECEYIQGFIKYGSPCINPDTKRVYKTEGLKQIGVNFSPSCVWSDGGPIIEREKIDIRNTFRTGGYRTVESVDAVHAVINLPNGATVFIPDKAVWEYGPTPLVAAMRCYVAGMMGDEIDVPDCLI